MKKPAALLLALAFLTLSVASAFADDINWYPIEEYVYGNSTIIEGWPITYAQLNKVLQIQRCNPENWYKFKVPQRGLLRFTINPGYIEAEYMVITLHQDSWIDGSGSQHQKQIVDLRNGVQSFCSFIAEPGESICWYELDPNDDCIYAPYLLYLEFIPVGR